MFNNNSDYIATLNEMIKDDNTWLGRSIKNKIGYTLFEKLRHDHNYYLFCLSFRKIMTALNNIFKRIR